MTPAESDFPLPSEYQLAFLCDVLKLSYVELSKQPDWWVQEMVDYFEMKGKADNHKQKIQEAKAKGKNF